MKDRLFTDRDFLKKLWRLMFPIALQELMLAAVGAADAIMLGNVAQNAMAAVSLATQIQFVQNVALGSIVSAITILGAQYWGKRDEASMQKVFFIGLRVAVGLSFLFFAGCVFFPEALMFLYTNDAELIGIGASYLRIAGWSYLLTGIIQCCLTFLKITDHPGDSALISSVTVLINIVLNAVLIFGLFGLPAMEVLGAARATLIARAIELAWAVLLFTRKGTVAPRFRFFFARSRLLVGDYMKNLLPLLGAGLFWGIGFTAYTACIGHMGQEAAAANSVASIIRDLICCLCNGISAGGGIVIGNELGAGHLERGKLYGIRVAKLGFLCGFGSMGIMLLAAPFASKLVRLNDQAAGYLTAMMIIMAVYMIGRAVNTIIINGVFAAGGDTVFDVYSLAVSMWGIAIPLAALGTFVFHWPVAVVYACTCLDEVGKIPWVMIHFTKYKWVRDLTR